MADFDCMSQDQFRTFFSFDIKSPKSKTVNRKLKNAQNRSREMHTVNGSL